MSEPLETIKTKLRKIAALAERGVGGEKDNAQRLLQKLLAQYNLQPQDVLGERPEREVKRYWFKYKSNLEKEVLFQCYARATNASEIRYFKGRGQIGFDMTLLDALELEALWDYFRPLFKKEWTKNKAQIVRAFVWKHELFGQVAADQRPPGTPLSNEELEAIARMMRGMENAEYTSTRRRMTGS